MTGGGYDEGYTSCACFWGTEPGSLVRTLSQYVRSFSGLRVLDAGCGEGKNARFLVQQGASVRAMDISTQAINNGVAAFGRLEGLSWEVGDVRESVFAADEFDLVIAYGLFHCFDSLAQILETIEGLKAATTASGLHVVCAFNDRYQDLRAHPNFNPMLLSHSQYLAIYDDWELLASSDSDLTETHPHNGIEHRHSMTRLIARKR